MKDIVATKDNDNKYLLIELDNKSNSFTSSLLKSLQHWLEIANEDKQINSIILTSKSKVFSVGGDINEMKEEIEKGNRSGYVDRIVPQINRLIETIVAHKLPIICVLNGVAAGGGLSLALSCDFVFAKSNVNLVPAFGNLALSPDSGSSIILPYKLGYAKSLELIGTLGSMSVEEAKKVGAVNNVGELNEMMGEALKLAKQFAKADRWALSQSKKLMNDPLRFRLHERLENEYHSISEASKRDEFIERLNDMVSKISK